MPVVADKYRGSREYYLVYSELIRAAQYEGVTTYQAIAQIMGLPLTGNCMASETGRVLGEVSEDEQNQGRPLLSALCVSANGLPGKGFFGLAQQLGKLPDSASDEERQRFWEEEKEALYKTWQRMYRIET